MQGYPLYICGAGCNCNKLGREKLRREICESGTMAHMRENLDCKFHRGFPRVPNAVSLKPTAKPLWRVV